MSRGDRLGRIWYWRGKGEVWIGVFRQWLLPVMGSAGVTHYLGVPAWAAVGAWIVVALLAETAAVVLGWFEHRSGATAANYRIAAETDPYKVEHLALEREILAALRQLPRRADSESYRLRPR